MALFNCNLAGFKLNVDDGHANTYFAHSNEAHVNEDIDGQQSTQSGNTAATPYTFIVNSEGFTTLVCRSGAAGAITILGVDTSGNITPIANDAKTSGEVSYTVTGYKYVIGSMASGSAAAYWIKLV